MIIMDKIKVFLAYNNKDKDFIKSFNLQLDITKAISYKKDKSISNVDFEIINPSPFEDCDNECRKKVRESKLVICLIGGEFNEKSHQRSEIIEAIDNKIPIIYIERPGVVISHRGLTYIPPQTTIKLECQSNDCKQCDYSITALTNKTETPCPKIEEIIDVIKNKLETINSKPKLDSNDVLESTKSSTLTMNKDNPGFLKKNITNIKAKPHAIIDNVIIPEKGYEPLSDISKINLWVDKQKKKNSNVLFLYIPIFLLIMIFYIFIDIFFIDKFEKILDNDESTISGLINYSNLQTKHLTNCKKNISSNLSKYFENTIEEQKEKISSMEREMEIKEETIFNQQNTIIVKENDLNLSKKQIISQQVAYQSLLAEREESNFFTSLINANKNINLTPTNHFAINHLFTTLAQQDELIFPLEQFVDNKKSILTYAIWKNHEKHIIATAGSNTAIQFWQINSATIPEWIFQIPTKQQPKSITGLAILEFHRSRCTFITGDIHGYILEYQVPLNNYSFTEETKENFRTKKLRPFEQGIFSIATRQNDNKVVIGCFNKISLCSYSIHKSVKFRIKQEKTIEEGYFTALAFSPGRPYLACGTNDGRIMIWNIDSFPNKQRESKNDAAIMAIAFHPSLDQMVAGGLDKYISLYDITTTKPYIKRTKNYETPHKGALALAYSLDGKQIYVGSSNLYIDIFNLDTNQFNVKSLSSGHSHHISFIYPVSKFDEKSIISADYDGNLKFTHLFRPTPLRRSCQYFNEKINCLASTMCADGTDALVAADKKGQIYLIHNTLNAKNQSTKPILTSKHDRIIDIDIAEDGKGFIYCTLDGIIVYNKIGNKPLEKQVNNNSITYIRFYNSNSFIVVSKHGGIDKYIIKDNKIQHLKNIMNLEANIPIQCLTVNPYTKRFLCAVKGDKVCEINPRSDKPQINLNKQNIKIIPPNEKKHITCLSFSPDGKILAAGDTKGNIYLKHSDNLTKSYLHPMQLKHGSFVTHIAFNPDTNNKCIVSVASDKSLAVWHYEYNQATEQSQENKFTFTVRKLGKIHNAHENIITDLAFHPKGHILMTSGYDKQVRFWDMSLELWKKKAKELLSKWESVIPIHKKEETNL